MGNLSDDVYEFAFAFYNYKYIEEDILDYLIKISKEIYRQEYAVLFKWEGVKDNKLRKFLDWISEIEVQDDYRYICFQGMEIEDVGCLITFDLHTRLSFFYSNESDISEPNPIKASMKLDHDYFDMKVKSK